MLFLQLSLDVHRRPGCCDSNPRHCNCNLLYSTVFTAELHSILEKSFTVSFLKSLHKTAVVNFCDVPLFCLKQFVCITNICVLTCGPEAGFPAPSFEFKKLSCFTQMFTKKLTISVLSVRSYVCTRTF